MLSLFFLWRPVVVLQPRCMWYSLKKKKKKKKDIIVKFHFCFKQFKKNKLFILKITKAQKVTSAALFSK